MKKKNLKKALALGLVLAGTNLIGVGIDPHSSAVYAADYNPTLENDRGDAGSNAAPNYAPDYNYYIQYHEFTDKLEDDAAEPTKNWDKIVGIKLNEGTLETVTLGDGTTTIELAGVQLQHVQYDEDGNIRSADGVSNVDTNLSVIEPNSGAAHYCAESAQSVSVGQIQRINEINRANTIELANALQANSNLIQTNITNIAANTAEISTIENTYVSDVIDNGNDTWTVVQGDGSVTIKDTYAAGFADDAVSVGDDGTFTTTINRNDGTSFSQKVDMSGYVSTYVENNASDALINYEGDTTDRTTIENAINDTYIEAKKHTTVTAGKNVVISESTNADGGREYTVATANDAAFDSVTSTTVNATTVNVGDNITIQEGNVNMGGSKITNIQEGDIYQGSTDAVNGGQLWQTNQNIGKLDNRITSLGSRVDRVGAGAAALAALHPLDFDPDDKLSFAAGVGNYAGSSAAAIGAFYRPNERVMFSIGATAGNGENMVNAGISFALGKGGKVTTSRVAMTHEINDLRQQISELTTMVSQLTAVHSAFKFDSMKPFPDTPENHWAYEYIAKLAAEGIVEGYPSGNFDGDRTMTRYEFGAMLYRALQKGFALDERIIDEFEPEIGRLSVERIRGEQDQKNKIERIRVNDKGDDRDNYGGKINVGKGW